MVDVAFAEIIAQCCEDISDQRYVAGYAFTLVARSVLPYRALELDGKSG